MVRAFVRELLYDLRLGLFLRVARSVLLGTLLAVTYCLASFSASAVGLFKTSLRDGAEHEFVSITDTLGMVEFQGYKGDLDGIGRVQGFYNALSHDLSGGTYLSIFGQPIAVRHSEPIRDFAVVAFGWSWDPCPYEDKVLGGLAYDVPAVQLDKNAWDFYGLRLADGSGKVDWAAVTYEADTCQPVVLGSGYSRLYKVGDRIDAWFYTRPLTFEVVGFLEERSAVFYKGDFNYSLDEMVVIPYPLRLDSVKRGVGDDEDFNRALAFAMVSGDIALDEGSSPDSVANELALIGQRTGFTSYALLGTPEYLIQFRLIRNLVLSNVSLVVCTLALLAAVLLGLATVVSWQLSSQRERRDAALWHLGSSVAIRGRSGAGKTTLLRMLAGLDADYDGEYRLDGILLPKSVRELVRIRQGTIGYVTQVPRLLTDRSMLDNVLLGLSHASHAVEEAGLLLERVGLPLYQRKRAGRLSGGETQRVALVQTLVRRPRILLADEPTGSLDEETERVILDLLVDLQSEGVRVVVATHSDLVADICGRSVWIREKRLVAA